MADGGGVVVCGGGGTKDGQRQEERAPLQRKHLTAGGKAAINIQITLTTPSHAHAPKNSMTHAQTRRKSAVSSHHAGTTHISGAACLSAARYSVLLRRTDAGECGHSVANTCAALIETDVEKE